MATYRLGSSCTSRRNGGGSMRPREEEENGVKDDCDPDALLQCPYDKNHQIRASRFPFHLIKCGKNHPKLVSELKVCPFNARHRIPPKEFPQHLANCGDRKLIATDGCSTSMQSKWQVPVSMWSNPQCEEDWDKELEDAPEKPFMWKASGGQLNRPPLPPSTSHNPGLRAPRTLPWKN